MLLSFSSSNQTHSDPAEIYIYIYIAFITRLSNNSDPVTQLDMIVWSGQDLRFLPTKVVELSNFTTGPQAGKLSKSTCPTKIYLAKN